ncbi:tripartite tricarboxylate transporter TctB family protein [Variovorax ureilyticus]|uniref:tripartite tricarboxylate transporter TctB family protein n=1 Tax=Variovorax ureilyticus TaxID=1836198 RepID=UPI003D67DE7C
MRIKIDQRELISAGLMLAIGLATMAGGSNYHVGTAARMGPGFYPMLLGGLLCLVSLLMVLSPAPAQDTAPEEARAAPEYRAWACVTGGVIAFIVLGKHAGLVPATFGLVFISALGDRHNTWVTATLLGLGMSALAVLVFSVLLKIQFPLFIGG